MEKLGSIRKLLDEFPTEFQEIIKTHVKNKFENKKFSHLFNEFKKFFEFTNQVSELIYQMDQDQNIFKQCPKITYSNYSKLDAYPQKIRGCRGLFGYLFAGKKVTALKIELDEEFGLKSRHSNEDLANFIRSLSKKFDKIYKELEQNFSSYSNIVHSIANLELDNELCDKVKISFN